MDGLQAKKVVPSGNYLSVARSLVRHVVFDLIRT